jgi:hypothetical protein
MKRSTRRARKYRTISMVDDEGCEVPGGGVFRQ